MITETKTREYLEGWKGRRRTYRCTECGCKVRVDTLNALPKHERVCPDCRAFTTVYVFVSPKGKEHYVRAPDVELATLRAWNISTKLSFKGGMTNVG